MKKGFLILSMLLSVVCIFTACKKDGKTDTGTPSNPPSPPVVEDNTDRTYLSATVEQLNAPFMDVPDGLVINSEDDLVKLSQNYENIANCIEGQISENYYTRLAECIEQNFTKNLFENHSYLLVNFYHSSSETNIGYSSAYLQNGILNLGFDLAAPALSNTDIKAKPFVLRID
ncbi:MAG: hypothetical protein K2N33_00455, partial [Clostridia bacterium]|nr:hypothetical protein [Clostridia bacterium]